MYTFMQAPASKLHETNYTEYYSSNFDAWKAQFKETYKKYNEEISKVTNSLIVNHEYVDEQVTKTTFDNGYAVYVNFGYQSYITSSGEYVPERDYRLVKAED